MLRRAPTALVRLVGKNAYARWVRAESAVLCCAVRDGDGWGPAGGGRGNGNVLSLSVAGIHSCAVHVSPAPTPTPTPLPSPLPFVAAAAACGICTTCCSCPASPRRWATTLWRCCCCTSCPSSSRSSRPWRTAASSSSRRRAPAHDEGHAVLRVSGLYLAVDVRVRRHGEGGETAASAVGVDGEARRVERRRHSVDRHRGRGGYDCPGRTAVCRLCHMADGRGRNVERRRQRDWPGLTRCQG